MSSQDSQLVLCVRSALSNDPIYLKLGSKDMTIDSAIQGAISMLNESGKESSSQQLKQLYETHSVFYNNSQISKGSLISDLKEGEIRSIKGQNVEMIEINLITSHSGGK